MTPEQEALVEALRDAVATPERFSYDRLNAMHDEGFLGEPVRMPPPTLQHSGYYKAEPSEAGHLVLALAAERDELKVALGREKRLHSLLFDQRRLEVECASWCSELDEAEEQGAEDEELDRLNGEIEKAAGASDAARAAYVAAGGTP